MTKHTDCEECDGLGRKTVYTCCCRRCTEACSDMAESEECAACDGSGLVEANE